MIGCMLSTLIAQNFFTLRAFQTNILYPCHLPRQPDFCFLLRCSTRFVCKAPASKVHGITHKPVNVQSLNNRLMQKRSTTSLHPQYLYEALHYFDSCYSQVNEPGYEDVFLYYTSMSGMCFYAVQYSTAIKYADTLEKKLAPHITAIFTKKHGNVREYPFHSGG
jgi:hypothetical protein